MVHWTAHLLDRPGPNVRYMRQAHLLEKNLMVNEPESHLLNKILGFGPEGLLHHHLYDPTPELHLGVILIGSCSIQASSSYTANISLEFQRSYFKSLTLRISLFPSAPSFNLTSNKCSQNYSYRLCYNLLVEWMGPVSSTRGDVEWANPHIERLSHLLDSSSSSWARPT